MRRISMVSALLVILGLLAAPRQITTATATAGYGPFSYYQFTTPERVTAGVPFTFTVPARDQLGNLVQNYAGTFTFLKDVNEDPQATGPLPYTFTPADHGKHTFVGGATFRTAGVQAINASQGYSNSAGVYVLPAPADHVVVTLAPSLAGSLITGRPFAFFTTVKDAFGNDATNYRGTLHFSVTGVGRVAPALSPGATVPPDYTFVASDFGSHRFLLTYGQSGSYQLSATDTVKPSVTGAAVVNIDPAAEPATFIVTTTGNSGDCSAVAVQKSLACAITLANGAPTDSPKIIRFALTAAGCSAVAAHRPRVCASAPNVVNVPLCGAGGVCTITPTSPLPTITAPWVTVDGTSETGYTANSNDVHAATGDNANVVIRIDGGSLSAPRPQQDAAPAGTAGLVMNGIGDVTQGVSMTNWPGAGIIVNNQQAIVRASLLGLEPGGTAQPNNTGLYLGTLAGLTQLGGPAPADRLVASGNTVDGLAEDLTCIPDRAASQECPTASPFHNLIQGTYLGLGLDGQTARPNHHYGLLESAFAFTLSAANPGGEYDQIGGRNSGDGNVISGNSVQGAATSERATVQGNFVGTDSTGLKAVANSTTLPQTLRAYGGLELHGSRNYVGGPEAGAGNLVSGNAEVGISSDGAWNTIQGNLVGTDVTGAEALPNGHGQPSAFDVTGSGINASGAFDLVGGPGAGDGNVFSGNAGSGINSDGSFNLIQGNFIGTDVTGTKAIPNVNEGYYADGSFDTFGGAFSGEGNTLSGNGGPGAVDDTGANTVQGNRIGTDVTGSKALPNGTGGPSRFGSQAGYYILGKTANDLIGGAAPGMANIIAGNRGPGVRVGGMRHVVQGNSIGLGAHGENLGNGVEGVSVPATDDTPTGIHVDSNTIAHNGGPGIAVGIAASRITADDGSVGTMVGISQNSIFSNGGLGIDLRPTGVSCTAAQRPAPNAGVLCPVIQNASLTTMSGTAPGCGGCTIEGFSATNGPNDQNHGSGKTWLGTTTANSQGQWTLVYNLAQSAGALVTATATIPPSAVNSAETSEFAANATVTGPPPPPRGEVATLAIGSGNDTAPYQLVVGVHEFSGQPVVIKGGVKFKDDVHHFSFNSNSFTDLQMTCSVSASGEATLRGTYLAANGHRFPYTITANHQGRNGSAQVTSFMPDETPYTSPVLPANVAMICPPPGR